MVVGRFDTVIPATLGKDAPNPNATADEDGDTELETGMLPAHRVEAPSVSASIKLKLALLQGKQYVETMEALAWEEAIAAKVRAVIP